MAQAEQIREEEVQPMHPPLQPHPPVVRPPLPIVVAVVEWVFLPQKAHPEASQVRLIAIVLVAKVLVGLALTVQVQRPVVMPKII